MDEASAGLPARAPTWADARERAGPGGLTVRCNARTMGLLAVLAAVLTSGCGSRTPATHTTAADTSGAVAAESSLAAAYPADLGPAVGRGDTLLNGAAAALGPWVEMWRQAMPGFALDSLRRDAARRGLRDGTVQPLGDFAAMGSRDSLGVFRIDSPDGRYTVVLDRYQGIIDAGGVIGIGGNVDSAPVLLDRAHGTANTFAFCGPACAFEWGAWVDASRFVIAGSVHAGPGAASAAGYVEVVSIADSSRVRYWTRPLADDELKGWRMAWGMWVTSRYREIEASRRHY